MVVLGDMVFPLMKDLAASRGVFQGRIHSIEKPRFLTLFPFSGNSVARYGELPAIQNMEGEARGKPQSRKEQKMSQRQDVPQHIKTTETFVRLYLLFPVP